MTIFHIRKTLSVETLPFPVPGRVAYRCTLQDEEGGAPEIWEGVCAEDDLPTPRHLRPSNSVTLMEKENDDLGGMDGGMDGFWCLTTDECIQKTASEGFYSLEGHIQVLPKEDAQNPYTLLIERTDLKPILVVETSFMIFDAHGPLPVAIPCDYLDGLFDNTNYDLEKALGHLRGHPHVRGLCEEVQHIPGYHSDENYHSYLGFLWCPDVETYRKAWQWSVNTALRFPSTRFLEAVFALDLLGLRACGAALTS